MYRKINILLLLLVPCLLGAAAPAHTAGKARGVAVKEEKEVPEVNWSVVSTGFMEVFKARNTEIEAAEPNRFFPGAVAFALGRIDDGGHFLMLNCGSADSCGSKRDALEDRVVFATLLDVVRTPKVTKDQLYNGRTWELSPLGDRYIKILLKRHPDLPRRLGRLVVASLVRKQ